MNIKNLNKLSIDDLYKLLKKESLLNFANKKSTKSDLINILATNLNSKAINKLSKENSVSTLKISEKTKAKPGKKDNLSSFVKSTKYDGQFELPESYERTHITLMSRDPYWIFSYWNMSRMTIDEFKKAYPKIDINSLKLCLQIIKKDSTKETFISEILPDYASNNYYIKVPEAGHKYYVDLGFLTQNEEFIFIARSNVVETPNDSISHNIDNRWITPENFISIFSGVQGSDSSFKLPYGQVSSNITSLEAKNRKDENISSNSLSSLNIASNYLSSGALSSAALSSLSLSSSFALSEENLNSSLLSSSSFSSQTLNLGALSSFSLSSGILSSFTVSSGILSSGSILKSEISKEFLSSSQLSSQVLSSVILTYGVLNETTLSSGILSSFSISSGILSSSSLSSFIETYGSLSSKVLSSGVLSSFSISSGILSSSSLSSFIETYGILSSGILSSGALSSSTLSSFSLAQGVLSSGILSSSILSSNVLSSALLSSFEFFNEYYSSLNLSSSSLSSFEKSNEDNYENSNERLENEIKNDAVNYSERMYKPFSSYQFNQSRLNKFKLKKEETFWN